MDNRMVWVDLETTGLDPRNDFILEIGMGITDAEGHFFAGTDSLVYNGTRLRGEDCIPLVAEMHEKSGLWTDLEVMYDLPQGPMDRFVSTVESEMLDFLRDNNIAPGEYPMCGSTINFDRSFLLAHMPRLHDYFHYRNVDVSSLKTVCRMVNPPIASRVPEGRKLHRPQPDIEDSVAEYQFYLDNFLYVAL